MVSVISGKRQSENRDCLLALSPPRCKNRKVSPMRDFPFGCGPHAALINVPAKEDKGGGLKSMSPGEKGDGPHDVEEKGFLRVVKYQHHDALVCSESSAKGTSSLLNDKNTEHASDELPLVDLKSNGLPDDLRAKIRKASQNLTKKMEESMSSSEMHNKTKDSMKVRVKSLIALKNIGTNDLEKAHNDSENEMTQGPSLPLCLLPYHPSPSCLERRDWKYLPRKGVSAVRDFPSGCGLYVPRLCGAEDKLLGRDEAIASTNKVVVRNDDDQRRVDFDAGIASLEEVEGIISGNVEAKGEGQYGRGASGMMIMPMPQYIQYSDMEQARVSEVSDEQHGGLIEKACLDGNGVKDAGYSRNGSKKEIAVCRKVEHKETPIVVSCSNTESQKESMPCLQNKEERIIVLCLMSAPNCPWKRGREAIKSRLASTNAKRNKRKSQDYAERDKCKCSPDKIEVSTMNLGESSTAVIPHFDEKETNEFSNISKGERDDFENEELSNDFLLVPREHDYDVNLPPFVSVSSSERGVRRKVRETLRLFHAIVRKLQQGEESKSKNKENLSKRIDFHAARILKDRGKYINSSKNSIKGPVPGVEVGDLFNFRIELAIVGLHRHLQSGIDYLNLGHTTVATSIVASRGYANDVDSSDVLIYTGQGGNASGDKEPEDQKLERGNLALVNSICEKNEVRVIRGFKEKRPADMVDSRPKTIATYTYDGLYTVEKYWQDIGPHGKLVYKFELRRIPGQPGLSWKEVTRSKNFKVREGRCLDDISGGRETVPVCAINTLDDDRPPSFTYITSMMYPDWCQPLPPTGCDCKDGCSDSERCACAVKNRGEIPYNYDGAIVEAKPLVYECGPSCNCPSTCHNRVSQYGVKFPLEIFKTESRGWGVRCLSSIPSGSFICEYIGELLDDKEAEQRTDKDEYLFDIGQKFNGPTLSDGVSCLMPGGPASSVDAAENVGFTIDAARYGNIGRFVNHSCSPNLYAQNVLYDHEDERIPHIMLFAADNIAPLQELTYDYNYAIGQVLDSDGNVRRKTCSCGSSECTGRMY